MVRLEQITVRWIEAVVNRRLKYGKLVADLLINTLLLRMRFWNFCGAVGLVRCNAETNYFSATMETLFETHVSDVLNEKSEISGTEEVVHAFRVVVWPLHDQRVGKWIRIWKTSAVLFVVQISLSRIMH